MGVFSKQGDYGDVFDFVKKFQSFENGYVWATTRGGNRINTLRVR